MASKCVLALSGGADSTTLLSLALRENRDPICVFFDYGSKHNIWEKLAATDIARKQSVSLSFINLEPAFALMKSDLLQSGGNIPEGHYEAKTMKQTVVPARNLIFLSIMAGIAASHGCSEILMGVHAGDHAIYPDCRLEFLEAAEEAIALATDNLRLQITTPFQDQKKEDIIRMGWSWNIDYRLTRTCYKNQRMACGRCGSCQERLEAFKLCGLDDPLEYVSREIFPK